MEQDIIEVEWDSAKKKLLLLYEENCWCQKFCVKYILSFIIPIYIFIQI